MLCSNGVSDGNARRIRNVYEHQIALRATRNAFDYTNLNKNK
jgi:hypothetical protein